MKRGDTSMSPLFIFLFKLIEESFESIINILDHIV